MRRNVGRKTDGYARRAVDEQVGKTPGQYVQHGQGQDTDPREASYRERRRQKDNRHRRTADVEQSHELGLAVRYRDHVEREVDRKIGALEEHVDYLFRVVVALDLDNGASTIRASRSKR